MVTSAQVLENQCNSRSRVRGRWLKTRYSLVDTTLVHLILKVRGKSCIAVVSRSSRSTGSIAHEPDDQKCARSDGEAAVKFAGDAGSK